MVIMTLFEEDRVSEIGTLDDESDGIYDKRILTEDDDETLIDNIHDIHPDNLEMISILNYQK